MSHVTRVKHSTGRMTWKIKKRRVTRMNQSRVTRIKVRHVIVSVRIFVGNPVHLSSCSFFWAAFFPGFGGEKAKIHLHVSHSWVA